MRYLAFAFGLVLLLAGCGQSASAPASSAPKAASTSTSAQAAASANPAGAPSAAAKAAAASNADWDRTLEAAKKEGTVSVIGPAGDPAREALAEPFQQKYGITVDYVADAGPGIPPRVQTERQAGKYLWDIFIGGTTTGLLGMVPLSAFDPLEQALILPEVKEPQNWRNGQLEFIDPGRQLLVMTPFQRANLFVNSNLVKPETLKSHKDLLDPKWKNKLVVDDPQKAGAGQATFLFYYLHPELGPDFIRALAKQEPTIMRDYQQEADAVGQGRFPILVGGDDYIVGTRISQGVPIVIVDPRQLREGSDMSPANGAVAIFNRAPHTNAARVYLNWLLSKDGQTTFVKSLGYISNRLDVPTDHTYPWRVPIAGAVKTYTAEALAAKDKMLPIVKEAFGS